MHYPTKQSEHKIEQNKIQITVKVLLFMEFQFSWILWFITTMRFDLQQNTKFPLNNKMASIKS